MSRFRYLLRTRYNECDAQKVVFNARYGDYTDLATAEYFRALGYEKEMQTGELDFQLVKQTTEWRAPARYDQVLEISVATRHLGNTSFTLATEFRLAGEERVIVTVETVYVHVDHHTLQKMPLTPALRAALERGAANVTIDHAAYLT
ncbi:acyl-CoA thioesterase [Peristeroidobacter soli]|uniref:acyl-CoA thioesterase n=1 Tax=Peristeroidobacter soli TaxID=2497877 RepID=UPI00101D59BF|nr:thioesterase family protein [Peristeroidobacter soli]